MIRIPVGGKIATVLMKVRFEADADLNQIIVVASLRRAPEVEFRAAPEPTGLASLAAPSGPDQRDLFSR